MRQLSCKVENTCGLSIWPSNAARTLRVVGLVDKWSLLSVSVFNIAVPGRLADGRNGLPVALLTEAR